MRYLRLSDESHIVAFDLVHGRRRDGWKWTLYLYGTFVRRCRGNFECLEHCLQDSEREFPQLRTWIRLV